MSLTEGLGSQKDTNSLDKSALQSESDSGLKTEVIFIGVGGATCSGKTTLAKHLKSCIPDSIIVHQDDFAPPEDLIPLHPVHKVPDWDSAAGAIDWPRLRSFLRSVKSTGQTPSEHRSHDHLNEQKDISVSADVKQIWTEKIQKEISVIRRSGKQIICIILDGFLLYWDKEVVDLIDVRVFLRVPQSVLRQRRKERQGYYTAEGGFWVDPPNYFDDIVYPAYIDAHSHLFVNGNVEEGQLSANASELMLIDAVDEEGKDTREGGVMTMVFDRVCQEIVARIEVFR